MSGSVWNPSGYINTAFAEFISFLQAGVGAVVRTVAAKLGETVSVADFGMSSTNTRAQNDICFYSALNSGARTILIPNGEYLLSDKVVIAAAALGINVRGEDPQNTILSWQIDTTSTNKLAFLLDAYVSISNLTIKNTGNDLTNSAALVSYTPTTSNGMRNCKFKNLRIQGWYSGTTASLDGTSLTMVRSQTFSNIFEEVEYNGCAIPIKLGSGNNNNVWIRTAFLNNKGNRHIYIVEGSSNSFISSQFEPVDTSVTTGMLNAELVQCSATSFLNAYYEPCYGNIADSSPGTAILYPIVEAFDYTVGNLSGNAILFSTDTNNAGVFQFPIVSRVTCPTSRAAVNPTCYAAVDSNANTMTLCDQVISRDSNFKLRQTSQRAKDAINFPRPTGLQVELRGTTGTYAHTYSTRSVKAQRVGDLIFIDGFVSLTAKDAGMTGNAKIVLTGIPWTIATATRPATLFAEIGNVDLSAGYTQLMAEGIATTLEFALTQGGDNVVSASLPSTGITATTLLAFTAVYLTDTL